MFTGRQLAPPSVVLRTPPGWSPRRASSGPWGRGRGRRRCTWTSTREPRVHRAPARAPVRGLENAASVPRPGVERGRGRGVEDEGGDGAREKERGTSTRRSRVHRAPARAPVHALEDAAAIPRPGVEGGRGRGVEGEGGDVNVLSAIWPTARPARLGWPGPSAQNPGDGHQDPQEAARPASPVDLLLPFMVLLLARAPRRLAGPAGAPGLSGYDWADFGARSSDACRRRDRPRLSGERDTPGGPVVSRGGRSGESCGEAPPGGRTPREIRCRTLRRAHDMGTLTCPEGGGTVVCAKGNV